VQGPDGDKGNKGGTGDIGVKGPTGESGATVAIDTAIAIASDANKSAAVLSVKGAAVQQFDIYWHVRTDQMWQYTGTVWSKLTTVSNGAGASSINLNGTDNRIEIRDASSVIRVKIGNLA